MAGIDLTPALQRAHDGIDTKPNTPTPTQVERFRDTGEWDVLNEHFPHPRWGTHDDVEAYIDRLREIALDESISESYDNSGHYDE